MSMNAVQKLLFAAKFGLVLGHWIERIEKQTYPQHRTALFDSGEFLPARNFPVKELDSVMAVQAAAVGVQVDDGVGLSAQ